MQGKDSSMRRREFIAGIGSAAASPVAARGLFGYIAPN
jgi:hypothetical protein